MKVDTRTTALKTTCTICKQEFITTDFEVNGDGDVAVKLPHHSCHSGKKSCK